MNSPAPRKPGTVAETAKAFLDELAPITIADAANKFLAELAQAEKNGEKSDSTRLAYTNAITAFRDQCGVTFMHEITREVLLAHKNWLFDNLSKRINGKTATTVANRLRYLNIWLRRNGIKMTKSYNAPIDDPGLLNWNECPRAPKKGRNGNAGPDKYYEDQINALLAVADVDEADLILFFLKTGFRDEEVAYAEWSDIDWKRKTITVSEKPKYNWRPKDKENRSVPIANGFEQRLLARKERVTGDLIFPSKTGKPNMHLIRVLQQVAKRAGFTERVTLHKFRRTYASMMQAKGCDLATIQQLLGHSDIATTALYLAADNEKARKAAATAFEEIAS